MADPKPHVQRPEHRSMRSGKGLGDALYLQSVVRHLVRQQIEKRRIEVCTSWPDVFASLRDKIDVAPFRRDCIDCSAHYLSRKKYPGTDQFTDCCISAGLNGPVELKLDWAPKNRRLIDQVKHSGKPVVLVQLPRAPMGRPDGFGDELLPDCNTIQRAIDGLRSRAYLVQVGAGTARYVNARGLPQAPFKGIDLDLANKTTVSDLLDVAWAASGALGYCSFIVPLAESLNKPALLIWSRRGLKSRNEFIRLIVPQKIIHRPASTRAVMDDCSQTEMSAAINEFCLQIGSGAAV